MECRRDERKTNYTYRFVPLTPKGNDFGGPSEVPHFLLFALRKVDGVGALAPMETMVITRTGMGKTAGR